ncbi:MAG: tetratricopeptide repeat protein, partial [bacterium]
MKRLPMWNWWKHRSKILPLLGLSVFLGASPIRSHILREEILALQRNIPFSSFFLAKQLEKWPPAEKEKLSEVYQWILEGNREKLLDLSPKSFPEDPYFYIALGRLIAFPEGKVNPLLSLRKQAYEFFQKALLLGQKQKDPYVEWILRKWFPKDLYQSTKDIFFLFTQIVDSHMGWLISPEYRLEAKIEEFPPDADFLRDMGEFLWRMGKKEEAGKVWGRAAQVVPSRNLEAKAQLLTKIGQYDQALEIYKILYRNSGDRNYILSILSQYAQKERLSEKEKIERIRWQVEAGFFYSALQGLDATMGIYLQALEYLEKGSPIPAEFGDIPGDAGALKALLVEISDLQRLAIVGILRNLAELLRAMGLGGRELQEARLDEAPYFHSLRMRKEIQSESLDFMGYLLGMCG